MELFVSSILVFCHLLCSHAVTLYPDDEQSAQELFAAWQREYGKGYTTQEEKVSRFAAFYDNLVLINKLNIKYRGETEFAINHFGDMSSAEFQRTVLMPSRPAPHFPSDKYYTSSFHNTLPDTFDWTTLGKVTSVKDQGSVGTCWAFSAVGNIEGQWAMAGKPLTNLSVEQVVDCDGTKDIPHERADCGVFGGWPYLVYQYVQRTGGLETWADYGYCSGIGGGPGSCFPCPAEGYNKTLCGPPVPYCLKNESCAAKVDSKKFVSGLSVSDWKAMPQDEGVIAEALVELGPLSIALDATMLQFYHSGVFNPPFCSKTTLNHATLLVGYGIYKGLFEKEPYWKVKNSWGAKWGEAGYFLIKRGAGTCGMNTFVTSAVLS